jgi:hypothetical protein
MIVTSEVALLPDVDNTLLDNDRVAADPIVRLSQVSGAPERECVFAVKRIVALNERDPSTAARPGSVRQETL